MRRPVYILGMALLVAFIAFLGIKVSNLISREGFEVIKNTEDFNKIVMASNGKMPLLSSFCPNNGTLVTYMSFNPPKDRNTTWACYPAGNTDVNSVFQNPPADKSIKEWAINIAAPKGASVRLFSKPGGTGEIVGTLNDANTGDKDVCFPDSICLKNSGLIQSKTFASIQVTLPSAAAPAAAPAAVPATVPAAVPASVPATVVGAGSSSGNEGVFGNSKWSRTTGGLVFLSDSGENMMNVNCPSGGDPKISFVRNTKNAVGGSLF